MPSTKKIIDYKHPIFWIIGILTVIVLILGLGLAYFSFDLSTLFKEERQNQSYSDTLNDLLVNLLNVETGMRGYVITQQASFLEPYNNGQTAVMRDLDTLKSASVTKRYENQMKQIESLAHQKIDSSKYKVYVLDTQGQIAAIALVKTGDGKVEKDELRSLITNILLSESSLLKEKIHATQYNIRILEYAAPLAAAIDAGVVTAFIYLIFLGRYTRKKDLQLNRLQEQFAAVASHQLRTPATMVKQYLHMMLSGQFGKVTKKQYEILKIINESNEMGIHIANDLLNVNRIDSEQLNISEKPINLNELLLETLDRFEKLLKETKNQKIIVSLPTEPIRAKVDQSYMRIIFQTLIDNASKYSDNDSEIDIRLSTDNDAITFSVKDQGHGISKQELPLLFRKFSRLDKAIKKTGGSGLGLYLVKKISEMHGGEVTVESEPNKGSKFIVKIPTNFESS